MGRLRITNQKSYAPWSAYLSNAMRWQRTQKSQKTQKSVQMNEKGQWGNPLRIMVNLIQINLGKRDNASGELDCLLSQGEFDVALIQEPCATKLNVTKLSGGIKLYKHTNQRPRTCIWLSKNLEARSKCILMNNFSDRDITTVTLNMKLSKEIQKEVVICSIYLPHKDSNDKYIKNPISDMISNLVEYCKSKGKDFIIGGDINSHHELWGSESSNERGENIIEFITVNRMEILNEGNRPTWSANWEDPKSSKTHIDVTLSSSGIKDKINEWEVSNKIILSDHKAITFRVTTVKAEPTEHRNKRRTNWERYEKSLDANIAKSSPVLNDVVSLEAEAQKLNDCIIKAYNDSCKLVKNKERFSKVWLDKNLMKLKKMMRQSYKKMLKTNETEDIETYKARKRDYSDTCDKLKAESWAKRVNEIEDIRECSRLQKFFETGPSRKLGTLKRDDGTYTEDLEGSLNELMVKHFPECEAGEIRSSEMHREASATHWQIAPEALLKINEAITRDSVEAAIDKFSPFKAPGVDEIFPALLQKGKEQIVPTLVNLFKHSLQLGHIPKCWRGTKVIFIPKPGKANYEDPKSYRPISLMSFTLKTLEKLVDTQIRRVNLKTHAIHKAQHAYQEGKGTDSALHDLFTTIDKAILCKTICLATFIDIEGAFDNTTIETIVKAAREHEIDEWIIRWIVAMLGNRETVAAAEGCNKKYKPTRGCPQGGCISPLIWCLVIDSLIRRLEQEGFHVVAYADDLAILVSGKFIGTLCERMNRAMKIIEQWCAENNLTVNPSKTTLMRFTNMTSERKLRMSPIKLFGREIEKVDEFKYLGIILDPKLNMGAHIKRTEGKALKALWAARAMVKRTWGINPKMTMWLYKQVVLPRITYGAIVWWNRAQLAIRTSSLNRVQRNAMLMVTGAMRTTPTYALCTALNIPPLEIKLTAVALMTYLRLNQTLTWGSGAEYTRHGKIKDLAERIVTVKNSDYTPRTYNQERNYEVIINGRDQWHKGSDAIENPIVWFSDGSRREGRAAAGIHSSTLNYSGNKRLSDHSTSMQAEIIGIEMCIEESTKRGIENRNILIQTDSQAALTALRKNEIGSKTILNCIRKIKELASRNKIWLYWVPGHSQIQGNVIADAQANLGIDRVDIDKQTYTPSSNLKLLIGNYEAATFKEKWGIQPKLEHSKHMMEKPDQRRADTLLNMGRKGIRVAIGILTGQCCLKKYLKIIKKVDDDKCRFCTEQEETMMHLLTKCPAIARRRLAHLGAGTLQEEELKKVDLKDLMAFVKSIGIDKTFFKASIVTT